jgi:Putative zinc-finger
MNCRRIEKMIPLYVEGDIESLVSERIASHLEWCGRCNWLADEYKESQNWLRATETPLFDEAYLADFKRDVMKQVGSTGARQSLIASLAQHWNRRRVLALCATMMIIVGALVLYLYQTRANSSRRTIQALNQTDTSDKDSGSNLTPVTKQAPGADSGREPRARKHRSPTRELLAKRIIEPRLPDPSIGPEQVLPISDTPADSADMLRIEIQTGDPNIRIIWFAPKETESHQTKSTTD